jgi:hypothetical protein
LRSEEGGFLGSRMGDARLFLAEGQLKLLTQEGLNFLFDLFS